MKVYIATGEHFRMSGIPASAHFQLAEAQAAALALVNIIRADLDMPAEADVLRWEAALAEAQRARVVELGDESVADSMDGPELAEAAECDVWIEEYEAGEPAEMENVRRYAQALDLLTLSPNGDDFNAVCDLLDGEPYRAPSITGR